MRPVSTLPVVLALVACAPDVSMPQAPPLDSAGLDRVGPTPPSETIDPPLAPLPGQTLAVSATTTFTGAPRINTPPTPSRNGWVQEVLRDHTAAPALAPRLGHALDRAEGHAATVDGGTIYDAFELLEAVADVIPLAEVDPHPGDPVVTRYGYMPNRARWLTGGWVPQGWAGTYPLPDLRVDLADPPVADDVRQRGARQYCAAREAYARQGSEPMSMGKQSPFGLNILGRRIDFLSNEARVSLGGPQRYDASVEGGSPDGAQVYVVPLTLHDRLYPIDGVGLPSLGDMTVPVALVHSDSEVHTVSDLGLVQTGGVTCQLVGFQLRCEPTTTETHRREHTTASHGDAVIVGSIAADAHVAVPFLIVGPIEFLFDGNLSLGVGSSTDTPARVSGGPGRIGWLSEADRNGYAYHDGLWYAHRPSELGAFAETGWAVDDPDLPRPELGDGWYMPVYQLPYLGQWSHTWVGATQGEDHQVDVAYTAGVELAVVGQLIDLPDLGAFEVGLSVRGGVSGGVTQGFRIRQMLHAESWSHDGPALPATTTTVEPISGAVANFDGIEATLTLTLDLLFTDISISITIPVAPSFELASWTSDAHRVWDESTRLRMGTGGLGGLGWNTRTRPFVASHNPHGADYLPFVDDVDTCMALPPLPADSPPPAACDPLESDDGDLPRTHLCAYAPADPIAAQVPAFPASSLCASANVRSAWIADAADDLEHDCRAAMADALCQPVALQQSFLAHTVIARNADDLDVDLLEDLQAMAQACAAWRFPNGTSDANATFFAQGLIGFGACDDQSLLQGALASPIRYVDGEAPEVEPTEPCHP